MASYKQAVGKSTTKKQVQLKEIILSREINGKIVHLYNMSYRDMTDEEWEKEFMKHHNVRPIVNRWFRNNSDDYEGKIDADDRTGLDDVTDCSDYADMENFSDESSFSDH